MQNHIYKVVEIVGSSETGVEDAIQSAITRASRTLKHLRWFEIAQLRGEVLGELGKLDGKIGNLDGKIDAQFSKFVAANIASMIGFAGLMLAAFKIA